MHKKLLALLLALLLTLSVAAIAVSAASADVAPVAEDDDDEYDYMEDITAYSADGNFVFRTSMEDPYEASLIEYRGSATNVVIPSMIGDQPVVNIWDSAFSDNPNSKKITSITLPDSIRDVNSLFYHIPNVKTIKVPSKVKYFSFNREDIKKTAWFKNLPAGIVYLGTMAIGYKGTIPASLKFKAGTTAIYDSAFCNRTAVKSVSIPSGVTEIGSSAFVGCVNLKDAVVPASVKYIGNGALGYKEYYWKDVYYEEYEDEGQVLVTSLIPGFTMYVAKNSNAYIYARENGIKFAYTVSKPQIIKFQNVNGGTNVAWSKMAGVKYYRVFGKSAKGWQTICSKTAATNFTYKYKTPTSGKYYYYTVRALSANGNVYISGYNDTGWKYMYIAPPNNPKLSNLKSGISLSWNKPKGGSKFRVFRKAGSGAWVKLVDTKSLSYIDKNVKKGVRYSYVVRVINSAGTKLLSGSRAGATITRK